MAEIDKVFKIFALDPLEVNKENGNYPLQSIVPYGPKQENENAAYTWLKEYGQQNKYYVIMPIFSVKQDNDYDKS